MKHASARRPRPQKTGAPVKPSTHRKTRKSPGKTDYTSWLVWIYGIILTVVFINIYGNVFDHKIHLGGDNADYYILGKSLAEGSGYTEIHTIDSLPATHFPPGYPVLMAGVMTIAGDDTETIKKANGFFFWLALILLFHLFYRFSGNYHLAFVVALFTMLDFHLLQYSFIMMSEIPFLLFTAVCILLFIKTRFDKQPYRDPVFLLLIVVMAFSYHIRTTGIAVFAGMMLVLLLRREFRHAVVMAGGFILLILPWYIRNRMQGEGGYVSQLMMKNPYRPEMGTMEFSDWFTRLFVNAKRYLSVELPNSFFFTKTIDYKVPATSGEWLAGILIVCLVLFGLYRMTRHRQLIGAYLLATFGILLLWPDIYVGIRFMIPVIPFLIFLSAWGIYRAGEWIVSRNYSTRAGTYRNLMPFAFLAFIPLFTPGVKLLEDSSKGTIPAAYKNFFELATWMRSNTPHDAVVANRKGNLFYLYAHRPVTNYMYTLDTEEQLTYLQERGVDYVVLEQLGYSSTGRYLYPAIKRHPEKFKVVQHLKEPDTYLMQFMPHLGYTGQWRDSLREGQGKYYWETGVWYEGEWLNNMRNGRGTMYFPSGEKIEGTWVNDMMEGPATYWNAQGQPESYLYRNNVRVDTPGG